MSRVPRPGRRRLLLAAAAGWPSASLAAKDAAPAAGCDPAIAVVQGRTRITLALEGRIAWRLSAAAEPPRLLLELPGARLAGPASAAGCGLVRTLARQPHGPVPRILIGLNVAIAPPVVTQFAGTLVITLAPGPAEAFRRFADGRVVAQAAPRGPLPLVVIDPGHGGRDPGAIGAKGTLEKRVTLAAALDLKRQLEAAGRCRVALTRSRDVFVPLGDRIELARRREAALFLSLHADAAGAGQVAGPRGASVYTLSEIASDPFAEALAKRENAADLQGGLKLPSVPPEVQRILLSLMRHETRVGSERLAKLTVAALEGEVPLLPNPHRRAAFVVLKAPDVPSALVEMGFLSNPQDEAALNAPAHRAEIAAALAQMVTRFLAGRSVASAF